MARLSGHQGLAALMRVGSAIGQRLNDLRDVLHGMIYCLAKPRG